MSVYTVRVVTRAGVVTRTLVDTNVLSVVDELNGVGEFTFTYPKYDPAGATGQAAAVTTLACEVQVLRDGTVVGWGVPLHKRATGGTGDIVVTCPGVAWLLGRRQIDNGAAAGAFVVGAAEADIASVAGRLITFAQGAGKGDLSLLKNTPPVGVLLPAAHEWPYSEHAKVDRVIIDELAPLGFDWSVELAATTKTFRTWGPRKGTDRSATTTLTLGANLASYEFDEDGAATTTAETVQGDGGAEGYATDTTQLGGLVLQDVAAAPPGAATTTLGALAADRLARSKKLVRLPTVTTTQQAGDLVGLLRTGDIVTVVINDGAVQLNGPFRIVRIELDPRTETLRLTVNDDVGARGGIQSPNLVDAITDQAERVADLERKVPALDPCSCLLGGDLQGTAGAAEIRAGVINDDNVAAGAAIAVAKVDGLPALLVAAKDRPNHTGAQAIATVTGLQPALDAKADLAGATFTGGVSVHGATTDAAAGVRRAAIGGSATQTPRLILENPDSGGTRWALINTNSELQVWEFTSGTSKMTLNTLGDLSLAGNLPARGPTVRGGITQNELDGKRDVVHIVGFRHAPVNQTITNGAQTAVSFGNSSSVGNIGFGVSGGDVKILAAGHYRIGTAINFGITNGAGGSTVAGARDVYLQVLRAGAVLYEKFGSAYAAAGFRASVEVSMSEHLQVNDLVRVLVTVSGSNVQMEARLLPSGKPTTMSLEVAYDHAD